MQLKISTFPLKMVTIIMVKESIDSFVTAVVASGLADFNYTVTAETSDGIAVGKQGMELYP